MSNVPRTYIEQPQYGGQYQQLAFVPLVVTPEAVTLDKWYQQIQYTQYPRRRDLSTLAAPVRLLTVDLGWQIWKPDRPILRYKQEPRHSFVYGAPSTADIPHLGWITSSPVTKLELRRQHQDIAQTPFIVVVPPETITSDKWFTLSPIPPRWKAKQHQFEIYLPGPDLPNPEPPEPEPPEPEVRTRKPFSVKVAHKRRPYGGWNTVYFVDEEDGS